MHDRRTSAVSAISCSLTIGCPNRPDGDAATGAPDARGGRGAVSLGGGVIVGELTAGADNRPCDVIEIDEVDAAAGGLDDRYEVAIATSLECVHEHSYLYADCAVLIEPDANGHMRIPLTAL